MDKTDRTGSVPPDRVIKAALDMWGEANKRNLIPISGRSMLPLIKGGDHVLVVHGSAGLRRGDVIVFMQDEKMVAHRVLSIEANNGEPIFLAKGDNNSYFDPPVRLDRIVGRVLKIQRGDRWVAIDTPGWRILGWLIAVGMLAWTWLYSQGRDLKQGLWGNRDNRLVRALRWSTWSLSSTLLRLIQRIAFRWKE